MRQWILRGLGLLLLATALTHFLFSIFPGYGIALGNRRLELENSEAALRTERPQKMNRYLEAILWGQKANGQDERVLLAIIAVAVSGLLVALSGKTDAP